MSDTAAEPRVVSRDEWLAARSKGALLDPFHGRRQLLVWHFMFYPHWEAGCPSWAMP